MKFKAKLIGISTGGTLIALLNRKDSEVMGINAMDRVKIIKGQRIETVVVDIDKRGYLKKGEIGIFEEVAESLKIKNKDAVKAVTARKPLSLDYIRKKLDGVKLNAKEIDQIVWDIVHNKLSDVELAYFVAACYTNVLTMEETIYLVKSMVKNGEMLKLNRYPIIDKHCIGGIPGNRTTPIIVAIVAAAGYTMPKTSSRSITSPAGTADTMEVFCNVSFPIKKMEKIIRKANACIVWGGALNLAPADDKIIKVEKPLEIDAESQLLASIMAKKYSVSSTHILIDIPIADDAKIKNRLEAEKLKKGFETIGKKLRKKIKVIVTDGTQPIGNGVGPLLEARDVLFILKRDTKRPMDLEKKCLMMVSEIFSMVGEKNGYEKAKKILESGKAYKKFMEIVRLQGGKEINPNKMKPAKLSYDIVSSKAGTIKDINNFIISRIARIAGAPSEKSAGIYIRRHIGEKVRRGDTLYTIYSKSKDKMEYAKSIAVSEKGFVIK